ncbi:rRNA methyltransferase 3, mitochondrial [Acidimicrobiaceae bacterium]|nr:rRNA methyltransferase 3, mitochondrial [Acidimicrobiaceae bacterium]
MAIALKRDVNLSDLGSAKKSEWIVVVDKISDPGNLGTILRSAEAAGASAVVLTSGTVDAFSPKVVRASAGALFNIPVYEGATIEQITELGLRSGDHLVTKCKTRAISRRPTYRAKLPSCSATKPMDYHQARKLTVG